MGRFELLPPLELRLVIIDFHALTRFDDIYHVITALFQFLDVERLLQSGCVIFRFRVLHKDLVLPGPTIIKVAQHPWRHVIGAFTETIPVRQYRLVILTAELGIEVVLAGLHLVRGRLGEEGSAHDLILDRYHVFVQLLLLPW